MPQITLILTGPQEDLLAVTQAMNAAVFGRPVDIKTQMGPAAAPVQVLAPVVTPAVAAPVLVPAVPVPAIPAIPAAIPVPAVWAPAPATSPVQLPTIPAPTPAVPPAPFMCEQDTVVVLYSSAQLVNIINVQLHIL
ncbi:hypothetical protein EVJ58_g6090 [Rhodofomes roseus]|uniref:Uncharacterized protein n=1 Tax=Rhodofomes roseus TaxID=34475 RepID=A0A4Y9YBV5_9APHY|nr:hypothetical protein EVJ58_g6090 [Rhodofomes roseus]